MSTATLAARNGVGVVFALNGLLFASLVSRIPDLRTDLGLDNAALGLLLLAIAAGSLIALPTSGYFVARYGASAVVRLGAVLAAVGLVVAALGTETVQAVVVTAPGLFLYGVGIGVWDVAMNVEGAEVERRLRRTVMPRFHAGFSLGSVAGAGIGIPLTAVAAPMAGHLGVLAVLSLVVTWRSVGAFLPAVTEEAREAPSRTAWLEPRTLAIGLMVLAFAVAEGSANDWLSLALIDGYDAPRWAGVAGYSVFVTAMTGGRLLGPVLLDRFGRVPVLWGTAAGAAAGILLVVHGGSWPLGSLVVGLGILLWGLGASLGFPVGMSAAADDPARAAARVSVVSTIGYGAFLAGPPLLGHLGDVVGTLPALLAVAALMVPAAATITAARPQSTS